MKQKVGAALCVRQRNDCRFGSGHLALRQVKLTLSQLAVCQGDDDAGHPVICWSDAWRMKLQLVGELGSLPNEL